MEATYTTEVSKFSDSLWSFHVLTWFLHSIKKPKLTSRRGKEHPAQYQTLTSTSSVTSDRFQGLSTFHCAEECHLCTKSCIVGG